MPAVVLDASVASAWCFPDEQTEYTRMLFEVIASSAVNAVSRRIWAYEVRNSVLMGFRRGRITKPDSEEFLFSLNLLNIRLVEPVSYDAVFYLAQLHRLTVYDAAYLDAAMSNGLALASLDGQLNRAAETTGVRLFQP